MTLPDIPSRAPLTRAEIADAVLDGRLSPAEAADLDPSLTPLIELTGLTPEAATQRIDLTTHAAVEDPEPVTRQDMLDEAAWWQRAADDLDAGGDPDRWQEYTDQADYWRTRAAETPTPDAVQAEPATAAPAVHDDADAADGDGDGWEW